MPIPDNKQTSVDSESQLQGLNHVDVELRGILATRPKLQLSSEALPKSRAFITKAAAALTKPDLPGLSVKELWVDGVTGQPSVRVLSYRPRDASGLLPAILHVHGGGFVMGIPEMRDIENRYLATELSCAVYSVDYRLAPEWAHPSALLDVYAVLQWIHASAPSLGVDRSRIGIKGESAGGGIAAGVALYARDHQGPRLLFQHLIYPMLDDRTAIRRDLGSHSGEFVWTQEHNLFGWEALLGKAAGSSDVPPYAAAARASDVSNLPPTYIAVGGLDLFCEENLVYARRLSQAGVPVEFHLYPGAFHGFQIAQEARVSIQANSDSQEALRRAMFG